MYLGVHTRNGLTAKLDLGLGLPNGKIGDDEIKTEGEDPIDFTFDIGIGYSFIRDEKITLGVLGVFGIDYSSWSLADKEESLMDGAIKVTESQDLSLMTFNLGADVIGAFRFTDHFGMYANLGFRYVLAGSADIDWEYIGSIAGFSGEKSGTNSNDVSGKFVFKPTLGVIWTF